ncbi:MAG TPA: 6-carboxytetrahydropterin synthase [Bryobacteraceae bacterium]|jgi:6-pyruvoyltetrahydropterin/6-carboxytetrahydropterin synthase|nr:6-carboxytetrahydropterin synthase [Bryobacteraceae bacterium]
MLITRRAEFSASHVCSSPALSETENRALYGAAANPAGHGHNYVLEVTLEGEPDPVTGMVFDLSRLKEILNEAVIGPMDHRFLNHEVPPFARIVPTAENIAVEIWRRLSPCFDNGVALRNVRLYETEDLWVDYSGEAA